MSKEYDNYIKQHVENVYKGFKWIEDNAPELLLDEYSDYKHLIFNHDTSKHNPDEYEAYDTYFYGGNRSFEVVSNFRRAWLLHIHRNPHHWQYWVLINDDPEEGEILLDMPLPYIIEMVCDWWAFSWKKGNLYEIFKWYEEHKGYMKLSSNTRANVEYILAYINAVLDIKKEKK